VLSKDLIACLTSKCRASTMLTSIVELSDLSMSASEDSFLNPVFIFSFMALQFF